MANQSMVWKPDKKTKDNKTVELIMKQEDYFHMILLWSIFEMIQIIALRG